MSQILITKKILLCFSVVCFIFSFQNINTQNLTQEQLDNVDDFQTGDQIDDKIDDQTEDTIENGQLSKDSIINAIMDAYQEETKDTVQQTLIKHHNSSNNISFTYKYNFKKYAKTLFISIQKALYKYLSIALFTLFEKYNFIENYNISEDQLKKLSTEISVEITYQYLIYYFNLFANIDIKTLLNIFPARAFKISEGENKQDLDILFKRIINQNIKINNNNEESLYIDCPNFNSKTIDINLQNKGIIDIEIKKEKFNEFNKRILYINTTCFECICEYLLNNDKYNKKLDIIQWNPQVINNMMLGLFNGHMSLYDSNPIIKKWCAYIKQIILQTKYDQLSKQSQFYNNKLFLLRSIINNDIAYLFAILLLATEPAKGSNPYYNKEITNILKESQIKPLDIYAYITYDELRSMYQHTPNANIIDLYMLWELIADFIMSNDKIENIINIIFSQNGSDLKEFPTALLDNIFINQQIELLRQLNNKNAERTPLPKKMQEILMTFSQGAKS